MRARPVCFFFVLQILFILLVTRGRAAPGAEEEAARLRELQAAGDGRICLVGRAEEIREQGAYTSFVLRAGLICREDGTEAAPDVLVSVRGQAGVFAGCTAAVRGEAAPVGPPENPGGFDREAWHGARGILWECEAEEVWIEECGGPAPEWAADGAAYLPPLSLPGRALRALSGALAGAREAFARRITEVYPGREGEVFAALLAGSRTAMQSGTRALFERSGLIHILAISGLHISLIGRTLLGLLRRAGAPRAAAGAAAVSVMGLYTLFTGASVSAVRAFLMFLLSVAAGVLGRTYDPLTALSATGSAMLAVRPLLLYDTGFRFSFAAAMICILCAGRGRGISAVLVSFGLLPLTLAGSFELPVFGAALNALMLPLVPALMAAGAAGSLIGGPPAVPGFLLARGCLLVLTAASRLPFFTIAAGSPSLLRCALFLAGIVFWGFASRRLRLSPRRFFLYPLLPVLVLILIFRPTSRDLSLTFLSVGQGDAVSCALPDGGRILVDCGSSDRREVGRRILMPSLMYEAAGAIDYVFVTHMDEDHVSGIRELLADIASGGTPVRVGAVVFPALRDMAETGELAKLARRAGARVLTAAAGDRFALGEVEIRVLGPPRDLSVAEGEPNARSLVLELTYGDFNALLTGDVEGAGEEALVRALAGRAGGTEVLKVAHHGSGNSTPEAFLKEVRPRSCVISCGRNNRYGHPHGELLDRLAACGAETIRTDRSGAVTVRTDGRGWTLRTALSDEQK